VDKGLPVTRVISRVTLQQILTRAIIRLGGTSIISNSSNVVGYEEYKDATTGEGRPGRAEEDTHSVNCMKCMAARVCHSAAQGAGAAAAAAAAQVVHNTVCFAWHVGAVPAVTPAMCSPTTAC
jgi:hypothetical protein